MYLIQRQHRGFEQVERFIDREYAVLLGIMRKILTLEVLHDDICRTVFFKVIPQGNDVSLADELGKGLGLFQKAVFAYLKGVAFHLRSREHGKGHTPVGGAAGVILLDGDLAVKLQIIADIRDAEAACAEHLADKISAVEDSIDRQLVQRVLGIHIAAADRALPVHRRSLRHTAWAKENFFHAALLRMVFYIQYIIPCCANRGQ